MVIHGFSGPLVHEVGIFGLSEFCEFEEGARDVFPLWFLRQ